MAILCMDANFRLKNNLVSNYSQDPGLGTGWAYMIPRKPYEKYVLGRANDEDVSFLSRGWGRAPLSIYVVASVWA